MRCRARWMNVPQLKRVCIRLLSKAVQSCLGLYSQDGRRSGGERGCCYLNASSCRLIAFRLGPHAELCHLCHGTLASPSTASKFTVFVCMLPCLALYASTTQPKLVPSVVVLVFSCINKSTRPPRPPIILCADDYPALGVSRIPRIPRVARVPVAPLSPQT